MLTVGPSSQRSQVADRHDVRELGVRPLVEPEAVRIDRNPREVAVGVHRLGVELVVRVESSSTPIFQWNDHG